MADTDVNTAPTASRGAADRYARYTGLAVGALAACLLAPLHDGDGVLYAIPAFGLCAVGGVLLGDARNAPARSSVRAASLTPRRVRDYVPPRMTVLLLVLAVALLALLAIAGAVATPDDLGRAGRQLALTCGGVTEGRGPWPGFYYGVPILAALAVATIACGWSLRRIATRIGDERSRRDRSLAIVAAWGIVVSTSLLGTASTAAGALSDMTCDGTAGTVANAILLPLAVVSLVTAPWMLFTVCSPRAAWWHRTNRGARR